MPSLDYRPGIDVGGTNTDAVIMDTADRVLAKAKVPPQRTPRPRPSLSCTRLRAGCGICGTAAVAA